MLSQYSTSTHRLVWLNWPKNIRNGKKGFANASDYLETWDDSDSITAANTQKDLRHAATWLHNHLESQYQGSETNYEHTSVLETELGLNPTILQVYGLVTRDPNRKKRKPSSLTL